MSGPPFKVKAVYEYSSPHEDDLSFPNGQIITVTEEEDADWYVGEFTGQGGEHHSGLFPKNFVEKYEPEVPSRPSRPTRPKASAAAQPEPTPEPAPVQREEDVAPSPLPKQTKPVPEPVAEAAQPVKESVVSEPHVPEPVSKAVEPPSQPASASKPAPSPAAKGPPPPVSEKPSSFRDRIAAFNKQETPVTPFKPSGAGAGGSTGFIKKPFVAPPPSRNAYVPPATKPEPPPKVYRREEDPEIAERQAEDQAAAETAGLTSSQPVEDEAGEDAPKPQSLKDRIALLQKQQAEQAQRRSEATQNEKPKKPTKRRTEDSESLPVEELEGAELSQIRSGDQTERPSDDLTRERTRTATEPITSPPPMSPSSHREQEILSEGDEADQSAAGETTEANEDTSDAEDSREVPATQEQIRASRAPAAPKQEPDVGEEDDTTEGEAAEDDMDPETRRRLELRERMAKMSGGMGMAGMFGPQPGMAIPGAPKPRAAKPAKPARDAEEEPVPPPQQQARVPMIPVPGMGGVVSPPQQDRQLAVEKKDEPEETVTAEREPEEVPDVEDVKPEPLRRTSISRDRPLRRQATGERAVPPPPVPAERAVPQPPAPEARAVPPPPPSKAPQSPRQERDDPVLPPPPPKRTSVDTPRSMDTSLPARSAPPPVPGVQRNTSISGGSITGEPATTSPRPGRGVPPPVPTAQSRPVPPPPPAVPAPTQAPVEEPDEGESEYEGDYDTDIAAGESHKDALKAHAREPSLDESTIGDGESAKSPPPPVMSPPNTHRAVPPPPPATQASKRTSVDVPRAAPPPIPPSRNEEPDIESGEEEYVQPTTREAPRAAPPPPSGAPNLPPIAVGGGFMQGDSSDDQYAAASPPSRQPERPSQERSAPLPPAQSPPMHSRQSESGVRPGRKSLDAQQTLGRTSTEVTRPTGDGFIATDIDLAESTQWWTAPNAPPPAFQNRNDILYEVEDSSTSKRGGKTTISRDVYALFLDYSQTVITARFDKANPSDVHLEQRHEPSPPRLRQDQLESYWQRFGSHIAGSASALSSGKKDSTLGDGQPATLALELIKARPSALLPVGTRAYGALVYSNLANASVQQFDEIRPGDILTFRNAKLQGKHGGLHQKYSMDLGTFHVAVVMEWDGTKKKIRALEQGREKKKGAQVESFRLGDLKSGEAKVWRVVGREWVGWDGES